MSPIERPALEAVPIRDRLLLWSRRFDSRRVLAVALAVLVALVLYNVVSRARSTVAQLGTRTPVVVARRDLAAGETLVAADLETKQWPVDLVPRSTITSAPEGRVVREPIVAGEAVIDRRLFPSDSLVGRGERQITLPQPLAPPPVAVGDHVELYGMLPPDNPFVTAPRLLTSAIVVAFDEVGISVAVPESAVADVIEHLVLGVIEIVQAP